MESPEQFIKCVNWTPVEKKAARRAFDEALGRKVSAIIAEAKRRMVNVTNPSDLWELEAYLTESRKTVDRVYQYRYSDLLRGFSIPCGMKPHARRKYLQLGLSMKKTSMELMYSR
jgi:Photoprotection regulator fluorescence recovery protein